MNTKKTDDTNSEERSASLYLAQLCRVITLALIQLDKTKKEKLAPDILYELGMCFAELGLEKEAIDVHKTIVSIWPGHVQSHRKMGLLYFLSDQNEQAIQSYNEVLRLRPDDIDAYSSLGDCYLNLGLLDKAVEAYKKAIQISPKDEGLHISLAVSLFEKMQKVGPAIKKYNEFAGANKVPRETILRGIESYMNKETPNMMEVIRKEGLEYDTRKVCKSATS